MSGTDVAQSNEPQVKTHTKAHLNLVKLYLAIGILVYALMMIAGVAMRAAQGASLFQLDATLFYQIMTLHGAGMIGVSGLAGLAVNWYFLSRYVVLSTKLFFIALLLSLIAVVMIIGSILLGKFAAGWTFLYPLPAKPLGAWSVSYFCNHIHCRLNCTGCRIFAGVPGYGHSDFKKIRQHHKRPGSTYAIPAGASRCGSSNHGCRE